MKIYQVFRVLLFLCLLVISVIGFMYYYNLITEKMFALISALTALVATVFGIFSNRPAEKEVINSTVDKLIESYEDDSIKRIIKIKKDVKNAKEEEKKIKEYLDKKSNEIFLIKTREYLIADALKTYEESNLKNILDEVKVIEDQLSEMQVKFDGVDLPEKFKELLINLDRRRNVELYLDLIDEIPLLPFKRAIRAYLNILIKEGKIDFSRKKQCQ